MEGIAEPNKEIFSSDMDSCFQNWRIISGSKSLIAGEVLEICRSFSLDPCDSWPLKIVTIRLRVENPFSTAAVETEKTNIISTIFSTASISGYSPCTKWSLISWVYLKFRNTYFLQADHFYFCVRRQQSMKSKCESHVLSGVGFPWQDHLAVEVQYRLHMRQLVGVIFQRCVQFEFFVSILLLCKDQWE